jgi:hypothetical protein
MGLSQSLAAAQWLAEGRGHATILVEERAPGCCHALGSYTTIQQRVPPAERVGSMDTMPS